MSEASLPRIVPIGSPWRPDIFALGRALHAAAKDNQQLQRELPLKFEIYSAGVGAAMARAHAARRRQSPNFRTFVISYAGQICGLATYQKAQYPTDTNQNRVELSYWLQDGLENTDKELIGVHAIEALTKSRLDTRQKYSLLDDPRAVDLRRPEELWMVTLPDDSTKRNVCVEAGLRAAGMPRPYNINDGVTELRQLWVMPQPALDETGHVAA